MVTQPGPHAARRRAGAARLSTECITRKDPEHGAAELAPTRRGSDAVGAGRHSVYSVENGNSLRPSSSERTIARQRLGSIGPKT